MSISERLKRLIEQRFDTLKSASEFTGIPYRSLQSYVNGKQLPGSEALITLHTKLQFDLNWLLAGDKESWPTVEEYRTVCVNLFEHIENEYIEIEGRVPYCGTIATIYNRVLHHRGVSSNPWENPMALHEAVVYEIKSYLEISKRIREQLKKDGRLDDREDDQIV